MTPFPGARKHHSSEMMGQCWSQPEHGEPSDDIRDAMAASHWNADWTDERAAQKAMDVSNKCDGRSIFDQQRVGLNNHWLLFYQPNVFTYIHILSLLYLRCAYYQIVTYTSCHCAPRRHFRYDLQASKISSWQAKEASALFFEYATCSGSDIATKNTFY